MYKHQFSTRIRYSETDQMGYCYYGNYAQFFEMGRVESLRSLGISYKEMEDSGIMLPVLDYQVKFIKPLYYDDLITIETTITSIPRARIHFTYEIFNEEKVLVSKAETTLVFLNKERMKPCPPPNELVDVLKSYF